MHERKNQYIEQRENSVEEDDDVRIQAGIMINAQGGRFKDKGPYQYSRKVEMILEKCVYIENIFRYFSFNGRESAEEKICKNLRYNLEQMKIAGEREDYMRIVDSIIVGPEILRLVQPNKNFDEYSCHNIKGSGCGQHFWVQH